MSQLESYMHIKIDENRILANPIQSHTHNMSIVDEMCTKK